MRRWKVGLRIPMSPRALGPDLLFEVKKELTFVTFITPLKKLIARKYIYAYTVHRQINCDRVHILVIISLTLRPTLDTSSYDFSSLISSHIRHARDLILGDDALLYITHVVLIWAPRWAPLIPATRWSYSQPPTDGNDC